MKCQGDCIVRRFLVEWNSTNPVLFLIEIFHKNSTPGDINFFNIVPLQI